MRTWFKTPALLAAVLVGSVASLTALAIPKEGTPPAKHATLAPPVAALVVETGQFDQVATEHLAALKVGAPEITTLTFARQTDIIEVPASLTKSAIEPDVGATLADAAEKFAITVASSHAGQEGITGPPLHIASVFEVAATAPSPIGTAGSS